MDETELENMTPEQIAKMQIENCIFCKIVAGEIPSKKIYEDSDFIGILDINPATEGHVLLLPKQHYQIMPQMPPEIVGMMGIACANISSKIIRGFKCNGTSVFIANGAVAGQRAPHFIVHIIPREDGDNIFLNPEHSEMDDKSFNEIKNAMISQLGGKPSNQSPASQSPASNNSTFSKKEKIEKEADVELESEYDLEDEDNLEYDEEPQNNEFDEQSKKESKKARENSKKKETKKEPQKKSSSIDKIDYDKLGRLFGQ